jgi:hypothetical protein
VDVQRLARPTLVKISASDSPASSSASATPNRFRDLGETHLRTKRAALATQRANPREAT